MKPRTSSPLLECKRFAVLGAGITGCSTARLLRSLGRDVLLIDATDRSGEDGVKALMDEGVSVQWGAIDESGASEILATVDALIPSPGVAAEHPLRALATQKGIPVASEIELAWLCSGKAKVAAITGTNGKTTVTMLVHHLLEAAGFRAVECGNIGLGFADAVLQAGDELDNTYFVVEVSSFQFETVIDFAPDVGLILNVTPDHLDRHHTMEAYIEAKGRVTTAQTAKQTFVANQDDAACLKVAYTSPAKVLKFSIERPVEEGAFLDDEHLVLSLCGGKPKRLARLGDLQLPGMHNVSNCLAATCVATALGASRKSVGEALTSFKAGPHRLQHIATIDGVDYINDSKATNLDAVVKAIESFEQPIHLIAGGRDKDSPFETILPVLKNRVRRVYLIGEAAQDMENAWGSEIETQHSRTLDQALSDARAVADKGDVVLLAPGCASFDQFKSYADRGDSFARWVESARDEKAAINST